MARLETGANFDHIGNVNEMVHLDREGAAILRDYITQWLEAGDAACLRAQEVEG